MSTAFACRWGLVVLVCLANCGVGKVTGDAGAPPQTGEPPAISVGYDAFQMWDLWPVIRIGTRTYMRSTYDRSGGNEAADASHFLREESSGAFTTLDVEGAGVLAFVRTNHWHGSPWHYDVDGVDNVVSESSTGDPDHPVLGSTFVPVAAFPAPLALTWSTTQGADLSWVPIGFDRSLRLSYERTHYGTGYYIFQMIAAGTLRVSPPAAAWSVADRPPNDVLAFISRAGDDIAPGATGPDVQVQVYQGNVALAGTAGTLASVVALSEGPAAVRALRFEVPAPEAIAFGRARLKITWDDRALPSIDVPVALFFGAGTLYNRDGREYLVRALPVNVRFSGGVTSLSAYFPMPFQRGARIELVSSGEPVDHIAWQVRTTAWNTAANATGYFHATTRDHGTPLRGQDLVLLDTAAEEGGGAWCGNFVGTSFTFSDNAGLGTLEGDPRFFFDDSQTPQGQGTGTEEWGGGGDYWGGTTMTLPFVGHPTGAPSPAAMLDPEDGIESAYRFLLSDLFPFGRNARIQLEHGGDDTSTEHYRSVTYWYGLPGACLVPTDAFHVGDPIDEAAHAYVAPDASDVQTLTSRYEWGVGELDGQETLAATTDTGRTTTGPSEFTLSLDPENFGVLLRRKLDYGIPDQRAEVWVADDRLGAHLARAGVWYLAGSNRCLYSNPDSELGAATPVLETSDRRFRDDEFLIPRALTQGRERIRVRIVPVPLHQPISPGAAVADGAWSEIRYTAYVWKLPATP